MTISTQALRPCEEALQAMGLDADNALRENTSLFAHGVGLLLMQHTGRIRMFRQSADALFKAYVAQLVQRVDGGPRQAGLFGGTVQPNSTDT